MSDNKRTGHGANGKGYYIALILCAVAIGITGYLYYQNVSDTTPVSQQETQSEEIVAIVPGTEDVPVLATQPQSTVPTVTTETTVPAATERKTLKTMSPVAGEEIFGYSMEALSYNQTTRDWRVHNGVDLAADMGTEVLAAADGEVYAVYEDDTLGHAVIIRHMDGYTTKYASLSEDVFVKPGDTVTMGQTIGYAGDTAIVETAMGAHVHFSVTRYDAPIDPAEFLALGN